MSEYSHLFGNDIALSATGDIATVSDAEQGRQRVLRRLLTNPGDYLWQPTYGAGLGQFVGMPANPPRIRGVVVRQMRLEATVAQTPPPVVSVSAQPNGATFVAISYTDAVTSSTQTITGTLPNLS